jgi:4-amino-4-deoxy-L-arabinose transferase-like glycosyltransferase
MVKQNPIRNFLKSGWAIAILVCIWLIPGLIGHDPWKADEPYSFGMVYHIITTGDWVVPTVAGEPFMEKPPLFYITASILARIVSPFLPLHDGARLACAFYMAITFAFTALAARELFGKGYGRIAVLILMGSIGLVNHAHKLMTDVSLLTGFAVAIYGLSLSRRKAAVGGFFIGAGVGIGFMSKGLLAPGLLGIIAIVLPFWCREWRNRSYLLSLAVALLSALPWFVLWPYALFRKAPDLFREWFWVQNFGRFFGYAHQGPRNEPAFYLFHLPYFAWPAFPLVILLFWYQWRSGKKLSLRTLPLCAFAVMLVILSVASDARALYALPMLLPLSLLAVPAVDSFTPRLIRIVGRVISVLFTIMASILWLGWIFLQIGYPHLVVERLLRESPSYIPGIQPGFIVPALMLTLLWLLVIKYREQSGQGVLFAWASGLTLVWGLMMTIWLPFADASRSYRSMIVELKQAFPQGEVRIARKNFGESERAMFEYFGGFRTEPYRDDSPVTSNLLLMATRRGVTNNGVGSEWQKIWEGGRPGHEKELFVLYRSTLAGVKQ